ncbi:MAG TPA: hypothetical protein VEI97_08350 [bacterium]|nr:hypothetical protein [bacterium]
MARRVVRPTLSDELEQLFARFPRTGSWPPGRLAAHLGRNVRSIKENPVYRRVLAERQGAALPAADLKVLAALAVRDTGEAHVPSAAVASEVGLSQPFARRRLSGLVAMGYASVRRGPDSGYALTDTGRKILRASQPRRRRKS